MKPTCAPSSPLISIIIPCYNAEQHLERCLQSILQQTWPQAIEIIAVDDASTDNTGGILAAYHQKQQLTPIYLKHNQGPSAARNAGTAQAQGHYLWFVDSDDYLHPKASHAIEALMRQYPKQDLYAFAYTQGQHHTQAPIKKPLRHWARQGHMQHEAQLLHALLSGMRLFPWNKIIRKAHCLAHPFPVGQWFEDISTICAIATECRSSAWSAQPIFHYYSNPASTTGQMRPAACHDLFWALKDFRQHYLHTPSLQSPQLHFALASFLLKHSLDAICHLALHQHKHPNSADQAQALIQQLPHILLEPAQTTQYKRLLHLRYKNWRTDRPLVQALHQSQTITSDTLLALAQQR